MDYDLWAQTVGDEGWGYEGLLPYFKRTETYFLSGSGSEAKRDEKQHGYFGSIHAVSISGSSEKRKYPLREQTL